MQSITHPTTLQIPRDPIPAPTKLDQFKAAARNYNPASPEKFMTLCKEIAEHIVEVRRNYPNDEANVSAPIFDAIKELIGEGKYTAAQAFLHLIKSKLDTDHAQKMNQLNKSVPDKHRIEIQSVSLLAGDTERLEEIKKFFPVANQITCISTEHAEKMIPIEKLLTQIEELVPVEHSQPTSLFETTTYFENLFETADYLENPFALKPQTFGTQAPGNRERPAFANTGPLLPRRINFSLESVEENLAPTGAIQLTTGGRADFHQAGHLLKNSSTLTKATLLEVITRLENAIQFNHELAKQKLNGLLKEIMALREAGNLTQIACKDWADICSVMVKKTDDIETIRKLGIAFLTGDERLSIVKNLKAGRDCLEKLALQIPKGDLQSQMILAEHYLALTEKPSANTNAPVRRILFTNRSTDSSIGKTRQFFMLAVNQHNSSEAQLKLMQMENKVDKRDAQRNVEVKRRQSVEKPVDKKVDQRAIDQKFNAGMKYLTGNEKLGLAKDPYLAFSYFHVIAKHGHLAANFELGKICAEIYRNGINPNSPTQLPLGLPDKSDDFYHLALAYFDIALEDNYPGTSQASFDLHSLYLKRMSAPSTEATVHQ